MNQGWGAIVALLSLPPIGLIFWLVLKQLELFGRFVLIRKHTTKAYFVALIDSIATSVVAVTFAGLWPGLLIQMLGVDTKVASTAEQWAAEIALAVLHAASIGLAGISGAAAVSIAVLWIWRAIRGVPAAPEHVSLIDVLPIAVARQRNITSDEE